MNIFDNDSFASHEQVTFCHDPHTGLKAIIAIHDTKLGPALGGCRMYPYASEEDALTDVLRLARGMTYKSAISNLNFGGGKAVIIGDPRRIASETLFRTFGRFVDGLNGRYITAEDVNTSVKNMEWIRIETKHVVCLPTYLGGLGNPSPATAHSTFLGIKAALKHIKGNESLKGVKVAVQGLGNAGYHLCKELHAEGATIYVTDINAAALSQVANDFKVTTVKPEEIYGLDVDIFAPCAMGAIINDATIPQLKCSIIAGSANNQLADEEKHAKILQKLGILYVPDYVLNAGGLIYATAEYFHAGKAAAWAKVEDVYDTTTLIFKVAEQQKITTCSASNHLAEKRIQDIKTCENIYARRGKSRR